MSTELFEPKISNPVVFRLSRRGFDILSDKNYPDTLPLDPGTVFASENYGFTIIVDTKDKQSEKTYPTQCRLYGVEFKEGILRVLEWNKKLNWEFDKEGNFIRAAEFFKSWRPDLDFLANHGIVGDAAIEEINRKAYKRK